MVNAKGKVQQTPDEIQPLRELCNAVVAWINAEPPTPELEHARGRMEEMMLWFRLHCEARG